MSVCTSCADLASPPSLPHPPCGALVYITLTILTLLCAGGGGVGGCVGVRGGGVWGKSVELPRCILFICIFTLFSLIEVISFSSVVLFHIHFLGPPPPRLLPAPPIFECVVLIERYSISLT